MRTLQFLALLAAGWCCAPPAVFAGDCGHPYDFIAIEPLSEGPSALGQALRFRIQARRRGRGAWPECVPPETPLPAIITVSLQTPDGAHHVIPWNDGEVQLLPNEAGYYLLQATAPGLGSTGEREMLVGARGFMVGDGEIDLPIPRALGRLPQTLHFHAPGLNAPAILLPSRGRIRLPRIPGYWWASISGGLLYMFVGEDVSFTRADARLHVEAPHSPRLSVRVEAAGTPSRTFICTAGCEITVPRGVVRVHAIWGDEQEDIHEIRVLRRRARLVLRGGDEGAVPLAELPRSESTGYDTHAACEDGIPFALGGRLFRAGTHLCERRDGRWLARSNWPGHSVAEAPPGRPLVHAGLAYLATGRNGSVEVNIVGPNGHAQQDIRVASDEHRCQVNDAAFGAEGLVVVGQCTAPDRTRARGFLVMWGGFRTRTVRMRRPLVHVVPDGAGVVVSDANDRLHRCLRRCRRLPARISSIAGLVEYEGAVIVVQTNGALHTARGDRLHTGPGWNLPISRIVRTEGSRVALFGPEIVGSERHPFCVRSIVAVLDEEGRWVPQHVVGSDGGRQLDCQNEDGSPAVVLDIAAARGVVFARRRSRLRGETAFVPLVPTTTQSGAPEDSGS